MSYECYIILIDGVMSCPFLTIVPALSHFYFYPLSVWYSISQVGPMCESSPGSSGSERSKTGDSRFVLVYFWSECVCKYHLFQALFSQALASNEPCRPADSLMWLI